MAANRKWREEFIARMSREGMRLELIRALLRNAATLDRLACAQCNGDYPYHEGRDFPADLALRPKWAARFVVCPSCESSCHKYAMKGRPARCPDCRTADRVRTLLVGSGWAPVFGGDPRGCVLKVARRVTSQDYGEDGPAKGDPLLDDMIQNGRAESRGDVIGVPS